MAIEIPHEVALFLNFCGIPYPDINEDQVHDLARHVRTFATNVRNTHESATGVINDMGSVYQGYSYSQLVSVWAAMSATHMNELDGACKVVAGALDVTAEVIRAVKIALLADSRRPRRRDPETCRRLCRQGVGAGFHRQRVADSGRRPGGDSAAERAYAKCRIAQRWCEFRHAVADRERSQRCAQRYAGQ